MAGGGQNGGRRTAKNALGSTVTVSGNQAEGRVCIFIDEVSYRRLREVREKTREAKALSMHLLNMQNMRKSGVQNKQIVEFA